MPDLAPYHIALTNEPYTVNADVLVNVFFENKGWADSAATSAAYYWDSEATPEGYIDINGIPWANNLRPAYEAVWNSTGLAPGVHKLKVIVDPNGTVAEINETNNVYTRDVTLYAELLPDLTITGLSLDPVPLPKGSTATITVTVKNVGQKDATAVDVVAFLEDIGAPLVSDTASVPRGQTVDVPMTWPLVSLAEGDYVLNASVDPDDQVREANEANNTLSLPFTVTERTGPDLVVLSITPDAGQVPQGLETGATVVVKNQGTAPAPVGLQLALYLDEAFTQGLVGQVGTATIGAPLAVGSTWSPVIIWTVPEDAELGPHFLRAHVNWDRAVTELDETNNNATYTDLRVVPKPKGDLSVASIDPATLAAKLETVLAVNITVLNDGGADTQPTTLEVVDTSHNRTLDTLVVPAIVALGSAVVHLEWGVTGAAVGILQLAFIVDPDDLIDEEDELNNALYADLDVQAADVSDLAIQAVSFTPAEPRLGDPVTITVTVRNNGTKASAATTIEVKLGNNRIGEKAVGALAVGAQAAIELAWSASEITTPMRYTLLVLVDPSDTNRETERGNNEATAYLTFVKAPEAVLGDLTMSSSSAKVKDGKEVTLTVSLRNTGDAAATVRMVVKDGGTEVGSASAVIVPANGSKTETFVVKLTGKGDHVLAVTVFRGTTQVEGLNATVTVKVEKEEDGPGFGPAAAIAALGAAVAVAAVVSRRRRRN
jgi:subtilase family serine protease